MRQKTLGKTGLSVSTVSLGTWAMGNDFFGAVDDNDSIDAIRTSVENGINLIDTAPAYGAGHAEEVVGKALKGIRDRVIISTKCGTIRLPGKFVRDLSPQAVRDELEVSLRRLGTDYIDIYLLHWPDENVPLEKTAEEMAKLKQSGKFKYFGVSNFNIEQIEVIEQFLPVEVVQPQYSILVRDRQELIDYCDSKDIGIMSYGSLAGGILTGKYQTPPKFDKDDTRGNFYPFFKEPLWDKTQTLVENLQELSKKLDRPMAQIAINYATSKPGIDTALVGAKNAKQAKQNAEAGKWELSPEDIELIDNAYKFIFNT